jgi:hypothetical protein
VLCCAVLCCAVLCCAVLCCAVLYCAFACLQLNGYSFGTTGTVTIGGVECPVTSRTPHTRLICTLPAGTGRNLPVVVTVSGQSSASANFTYRSPEVWFITPTSSDTGGGGNLIVSGANFGPTGTLFLGPYQCYPTGAGWGQTSITCAIPEGQGTALPVVVTVSGQSSNGSVLFNYNAPTVTQLTPSNGPTSVGPSLPAARALLFDAAVSHGVLLTDVCVVPCAACAVV